MELCQVAVLSVVASLHVLESHLRWRRRTSGYSVTGFCPTTYASYLCEYNTIQCNANLYSAALSTFAVIYPAVSFSARWNVSIQDVGTFSALDDDAIFAAVPFAVVR